MDPRQLLLLLAVSEYGSITRAAAGLNRSQPALTKNLQDLELSLRVKLLKRSARGTTLTEHGQVLAQCAKAIASELRRAKDELGSLKEFAKGMVIVGATPITAFDIVPAASALFIADHPQTRIVLHAQEQAALLAELTEGRIDIAVGPLLRREVPPGIFEDVLYHSRVSLVARHAHHLVGRRKLSLDALLTQQWVLPPAGTNLRQQVDELFLRADLAPPTATVETGSFLFTRSLLQQSDCITALPLDLFRRELKPGGFAELAVDLRPIWRPIGISRRKGGAAMPHVAQFVRCLQRVARDHRFVTRKPRYS